MKVLIAISLALVLSGCAQMFTAKTEVTIERIAKDGSICRGTYKSDKEQIGLEGEVCGGHIKVDKSGTMAEVVQATRDMQAALLLFIQSQVNAARAGATAAS